MKIRKKRKTRRREKCRMSKRKHKGLLSGWNKGRKRKKSMLIQEPMSVTVKSTLPWFGFSAEDTQSEKSDSYWLVAIHEKPV